MKADLTITRGARRAVIGLLLLTLITGAGNLLATYLQVQASQAAIQAGYVREQAAQRQAGILLGEKLCLTFGRLAALKPPAGSPAANPSRAYLQAQHDTLAQLGADLGCR